MRLDPTWACDAPDDLLPFAFETSLHTGVGFAVRPDGSGAFTVTLFCVFTGADLATERCPDVDTAWARAVDLVHAHEGGAIVDVTGNQVSRVTWAYRRDDPPGDA